MIATPPNARKLGAKCDSCPLKDRKPIPATAALKPAKLILLGEAPGDQETYHGRPFVGATGEWLNDCLLRLKIDRGACHLTNAIMCQPPDDMPAADWKTAVECCRPRLDKELLKIQAPICAMGNRAVQSVTNKPRAMPWAGGPLWSLQDTHTVIPAPHPTFVAFRKPELRPAFLIWLQRAYEVDKINWVWPEILITPGEDMIHALKRLLVSTSILGIDVETQGIDPLDSPVMCIGIANSQIAVSVPWGAYSSKTYGDVKGIEGYKEAKEICRLVISILRSNVPKAMHNGTYDMLTFKTEGLAVNNYSFDTLSAHAVLAATMPHDLGFVAACEFPSPRWKTEFRAERDLKGSAAFTNRPEQELRTYNGKDAYMTAILAERLQWRISQHPNGQKLLDDLHTKMEIGQRMAWHGIRVDHTKKPAHAKSLSSRMRRARLEIRLIGQQLGMENFNPSSSYHIRELFQKRLYIRSDKRSKKTKLPSFDNEVLQSLTSNPSTFVAPAARAILRFRRWRKLYVDYVRDLPEDDKGYIHPRQKCYGTKTGRWSSERPNIQNIPRPKHRKSKSGKKILTVPGLRDLFRSDDDSCYIAEADASQLELRVIAILAGDKQLLAWYAAGKDVHAINAGLLFHTSTPTDDERDLAKRFVYACNYGSDAVSLWKKLVVDFPELPLAMVRKLLEVWFKQHPEIVQWQRYLLDFVHQHQYLELPLSGRRIYFHGPIKETEVYNYPVQGTGADIIDPALMRIDKLLKWPRERLLAQVHDSIVLHGPDPKRLFTLLKQEMERPFVLEGKKHYIPVDVKIGKNWGEAVKYKTLADVPYEPRSKT